jgi:hypothetical protein
MIPLCSGVLLVVVVMMAMVPRETARHLLSPQIHGRRPRVHAGPMQAISAAVFAMFRRDKNQNEWNGR